MDGSQIQTDTEDCSNCPACRARSLIYRDLIDHKLPMLLPIAQTVVASMSEELVVEFGGPDEALNSILMTAAEEYNRTSEAGASPAGRAWIARNAKALHFSDRDVAWLGLSAEALAKASGRHKHKD